MKRLTLAKKVIFAFLVVVIPLTVLLFYSTNYSMRIIRNQVSLSNRNLLSNYMRQIDMELESVDTYLYKTVSDAQPKLLDPYKDMDAEGYTVALSEVMRQFTKDIFSYPYLSALFLYDTEQDRVLQTPGTFLTEGVDIRENGFLKSLAAYGNNPPWSVFRSSEGPVMVLRMVRINQSLYMGAYIDVTSIMPVNMEFEKNTEVAMTDELGQVLQGSGKETLFLEASEQQSDSEWYTVAQDAQDGNKRYLVMQAASEISPLVLKVAIPEQQMLIALVGLQQLNYVAPVIIVLVLVLYVVLLRRAVLRPVEQVGRAMRRFGEGDWDTRLPEKMGSEFHQIAIGFNEMAEHIHDLKITMYDEKLKAERAEYNQLQMQINPHFYMNTLNIIYNMAVLKDYENVQKLSLYLANHFKYIIKNTSQVVPLDDELANTKNYLEINRLRFGDLLSYEINVTPVYNTFTIPMLTIQTFVENSVHHGFVDRRKPFQISVEVHPWKEQPEQLYEIVVRDTGVGFSEEYIKWFDSPGFLNRTDEHIGVRNTVTRLKLRYGEAARIKLENAENGGAIVRLVLPQSKKNDREEKNLT